MLALSDVLGGTVLHVRFLECSALANVGHRFAAAAVESAADRGPCVFGPECVSGFDDPHKFTLRLHVALSADFTGMMPRSSTDLRSDSSVAAYSAARMALIFTTVTFSLNV